MYENFRIIASFLLPKICYAKIMDYFKIKMTKESL